MDSYNCGVIAIADITNLVSGAPPDIWSAKDMPGWRDLIHHWLTLAPEYKRAPKGIPAINPVAQMNMKEILREHPAYRQSVGQGELKCDD